MTPLDGCGQAEYACHVANGETPEQAEAAALAMPHIPEYLDTRTMRFAIECGLLDASRLAMKEVTV